MPSYNTTTPIVFFIFKRPETTRRVFETIRTARPKQLFIVADGPRPERAGEAEACQATREVCENVDWECEVTRNYSDKNLGCGKRISSGLDWLFEQVEEAIILEDDCVPDLSFFPFCEELLEKYRHDTRIMSISGQNSQLGETRTDYSYYFSKYNHCWGWATWKRAWKYYDFDMSLWPKIEDLRFLDDILINSTISQYWTEIFRSSYEGKTSTWDYQWTFACFMQRGLCAISNTNLVSNIGFGFDSTHTSDESSQMSNLSTTPVNFPLLHPPFVICDEQSDLTTYKNLYQASALNRFKKAVKKLAGMNR